MMHSTSNDAPRWLVPLLAFVMGVVVTVGAMMPVASEPAPSAAEVIAREKRASDDQNVAVRAAFFDGAQAGYHACKNGEPLPVDTLGK